MRRRLCQFVAVLIASSLAGGCRTPSADRPYPADPLLLSKKPADEKEKEKEKGLVQPAKPTMLAAAEPVMPPFPTAALMGNGPELPEPAPAHTASSPRQPVQAIPAVRIKPVINSTQALGQGLDHAWLQGILDKHYEGYFYLRYGDPSVDDPWGGKVRLEDDPRLATFQDGDLVRIEGTPVPGATSSSWDRLPRYRVRSIQLIRTKS